MLRLGSVHATASDQYIGSPQSGLSCLEGSPMVGIGNATCSSIGDPVGGDRRPG
jgi:hypothetical protein